MVLNQMILLSLLAIAFVLWPLLRLRTLKAQPTSANSGQDATQLILYQEHLLDLDKALQAGDLDQEQYDALKLELQRTLIAEAGKSAAPASRTGGVWVLVALAVAVPLLAFSFYTHWGAKADWELSQLLAQQRNLGQDDQAQYEQVTQALITKAKQRVEEKPKSPQWLYMLASYSLSNQDLAGAETYFRKLLAIEPRSPQIMAELAQALFVKGGNVITAEVRELVQDSLKLAPNMPTALSLAGIDNFQQGKFRPAIDYWTRALAFLDPQTAGYKALQGGIDKAQASLQAAGEAADTPAVAAADGVGVDLEVSIAPGLNLAPEDSVFVYARAWQGAKMPLAIQRLKVADLPKKIHLDKSMAMAPGMDLTSAPSLELLARVSKAGSPIAASGDWQASLGPVTLKELNGPVVLVIDKQIP